MAGLDIERRRQAVERLISLEVEDPPDPDTLARELEATHEPGGLDCCENGVSVMTARPAPAVILSAAQRSEESTTVDGKTALSWGKRPWILRLRLRMTASGAAARSTDRCPAPCHKPVRAISYRPREGGCAHYA